MKKVSQKARLRPSYLVFIASEERGEIYGRPVGITEDNIGNILITDDVGGRLLVISQKKEE